MDPQFGEKPSELTAIPQRVFETAASFPAYEATGAWVPRFNLTAPDIRKASEASGALLHVALNRFLVSAKGLPFGCLPQVTALDIQEQFDLPWPERVAMHVSSKKLLNQAIELR